MGSGLTGIALNWSRAGSTRLVWEFPFIRVIVLLNPRGAFAPEPTDGLTPESSEDGTPARVSVGRSLSYSWEVYSVVPPPARLMSMNHEVLMRDSRGA